MVLPRRSLRRSPGAPIWDIGPLLSYRRSKYCSRVNVPFASETAEPGSGFGRAQAQEHVFVLLRSVQREFRRQYVQLAGDHGLPFPVAGPYLVVLREISETPGATLNEVARLTGLPKSRVSVLVRGLADQGIVRKESDPRDSRLVRIFITPQGSRRVVEWSAAAQKAVGRLLQPCSDGDLAVIAEGLATLQRAFELAKKRGSSKERAANGRPC
jgi:DNA-binding MarR family transcriptional regulator